MRIDPREVDAQTPYRVPPNNPFVGQQNAFPEIWSYGLRDPWRFSFDRTNGDLNVGDVGQALWEEIDFRPVDLAWGDGVNFGWSCFEGRHTYNTDGACSPPPANAIPPVFEYPHSGAHGGCSITGGYVVRDSELPLLAGKYVYGDYCNGLIYSQQLQIPDSQGDASTGLTVPSLVSFGEDACGHVYAVGQGSGNNVFRIRETDPPPPSCVDRYPLQVLTARVEDDFTIELLDPNGQNLDQGTLPEGSYTVVVHDNSEFHNFHLLGPLSCVPNFLLPDGRAGYRRRDVDGQLHAGHGRVPVRPPRGLHARHVHGHRWGSATATTAAATTTASSIAATSTTAATTATAEVRRPARHPPASPESETEDRPCPLPGREGQVQEGREKEQREGAHAGAQGRHAARVPRQSQSRGGAAPLVDDTVRLTTVPGEPEAEALCGLLRSEGIECAHRQTAEEDSPFEGIATDGIREILVHARDLDRARELITPAES